MALGGLKLCKPSFIPSVQNADCNAASFRNGMGTLGAFSAASGFMAHTSPTPSSPPQKNAIEAALEQITQLGQAGKIAEATAQCQQLLQQHPDIAKAWDLSGLIALQQGKLPEALSHLERAIALDPQQFSFHDHAGVVHCHLENFERGIVCYEQALALNPQAVHVRYNLGLALQKLGRSDEALQTYLQVIAQQPQHAVAHYQVGNLLQQQWQLAAAIGHYQRAIQQRPDYAEAWYNLGVAWQQTGEPSQALHAYQQALRLKPDYAEALNGLGTLLDKQDKAAEALHCYQQALSLQPDDLHTLVNLGNLQIRLDRLTEAEATYRQVLQLDPDSMSALDNLVKIQLQLCNWTELSTLTTQLQAIAQFRIQQGLPCQISPLNSLFLPYSAPEQQTIARSHAQSIAQRMGDRQQAAGSLFPLLPIPHSPHPIRLGYVSGDFRYHAVGHLILQLFELHDRQEFQVFAYSLGPDDGSAERQKLMADCDCFRDVRHLTPRQIAAQIEQDQIQILIDLSGYTDYACPELFALRPAPIQVNYLGYPGTLGAEAIDYVITDPVITPPHLAEFFTETCIYLPDSYQLNSYQNFPHLPSPIPHSLSLPSPFTFCCFNKSQKIEPQIFAVWMRILQQVPDSVLWLLSDRPETEANLKREAQAQGIDPARILFAPRLPKAEHLTRQAQADLFLDTLYYNAHVTASDALWAGVPVITVLGQTFASRVGASLLTAIGLPELITPDLESYERLAVHLATHAAEFQQLKVKLAAHRYPFPLFNTPRTVRHLEAGLRSIWQRHTAGQPPEAIWVEAEKQRAKDEGQGQEAAEQVEPQIQRLLNPPHSGGKLQSPLPAPPSPLPTSTITCSIDNGFGNWLSQINGSLMITTYQAGKAILVGWNGQQVTLLPRSFARPMGVAVAGDRLALATQEEVLLFANAAALVSGYLPDRDDRYDALYLPRVTYFTGDLRVHDLAYGEDGLWMVNTRFSCLAQLSPEFSFVPLWQPPFVSELMPDDRCHLNGLAMVEGKPRYVTALGVSDRQRGWHTQRATGGILMDVETGEIALQGLSMPHSPRWHQGSLWLLNSGRGELWQINPQTWQHQVICTLPGFGRGLCLVDNYALVGLSQIREAHLFGGLPLQAQFDRLCCGVAVIDLQQGEPVGWLEFTGGCQELYDVAFLPGICHPALLSTDKEQARQAMTTPEFAYWLQSIAK